VASDAKTPAVSEPFELGTWRVEPGLNRLVDAGGAETPLEPRAMEFLLCLVRHAGETVSKERLLEEVWGGAFVVEGVIPKTVSALRQALGDRVDEPEYIRTVARRGYRLVAPVRWPGAEAATDATPSSPGGRRTLLMGASLLALAVLALALAWSRRHGPADGSAAPFERVAVAPFQSPLDEAGEIALAAALRSELIADLVRLERPRVLLLETSPTSEPEALAAARQVRADAVLLGQVVEIGDRIRADLRLVASDGGEVRWSTSVERPGAELWTLHSRLAAELMGFLRGGVAAPGPEGVEARPPLAPAAYRKFLEARLLFSRRGIGDLPRALELFREIAAESPEFAEGHAWLALGEVVGSNYFGGDSAARLAAAETEARRAVTLDPANPVGQIALGQVALSGHGDVGAAIDAYRRAAELAPSSVLARQFLAEALSAAERHREAIAAAELAVELEPLSPVRHGVLGIVLLAAGRPQEALESFDRALALDARFTWIHRYRAYALMRLGRDEEAARAMIDERRAIGDSSEALAQIERRVAERGLAGYWEWRLAGFEEMASAGVETRPMYLAEALAGNGRYEEAFQALESSRVPGEGEYFFHFRNSPAFDPMRDDPRFAEIYGRGPF